MCIRDSDRCPRTRRGLRERRSVHGQCRTLRTTGLPDTEWLVVVDPRPDRGQSRDESHDRGSPNGQLRELLETVVRQGTHTRRGHRGGIHLGADVVAGAYRFLFYLSERSTLLARLGCWYTRR